MSLLEGHGNFVMNELGRAHVQGVERMERVLTARRNARGIAGQLQKMIGIEMKLRQYALGESFVNQVVARGGLAAVDAAWTSQESLPTLAELHDPVSWLARMAGSRRR